jgi:hypothetical protein
MNDLALAPGRDTNVKPGRVVSADSGDCAGP